MPLNHLPLQTITRRHIDGLIANEEIEDRRIEYKADLPAEDMSGTNEICYDVTAFANGLGGDIVYGVTERSENKEKTGKPEHATGLPNRSLETVRGRFENALSGRVQPRLTGVDFHQVDGDNGPIIIVRVPRSWAMPHLVRINETFKCYIRRGSGKGDPLDVHQLRDAFLIANSLPERVREFRDDRIKRIAGGEMPVAMDAACKLVIHVVSLAAFDSTTSLRWDKDVLSNLETPYFGSRDRAIIRQDRRERFNLEGFLYHTAEYDGFERREWVSYHYVQFFRAGMIEVVDSLDTEYKELPDGLGSKVARYLSRLLPQLSAIDFASPAYVMISLLGAEEKSLYTNGNPPPHIIGQAQPFDRPNLVLPEVLVDDFNGDFQSMLVPALDALWQAGGWSGYFEN